MPTITNDSFDLGANVLNPAALGNDSFDVASFVFDPASAGQDAFQIEGNVVPPIFGVASDATTTTDGVITVVHRFYARTAADSPSAPSDTLSLMLLAKRRGSDAAFVIDFAAGGSEVVPISFGGTVAESRPHYSRHNVYAVQFASQQTNPIQLIPDDDFRDPALADYTWDSIDSWQRLGDALVSYSAPDHSVQMRRFVEIPPRAIARTGGLVQRPVVPIFLDRQFTVLDEGSAAATFGGLQSPLVAPSRSGRITAASRVVLDTDLTSPLVLQIVSASNDYVLAEKEITGNKGERLEWFVEYDIGSFFVPPPPPPVYEPTTIVGGVVATPVGDGVTDQLPQPPQPPVTTDEVVRVRLIQRGKSDDAWRLDTLSAFDDGILWEFSVNGGDDFFPANRIRNKKTGVLRFPEPGNALVYRVTATRPGVGITALKIRPWYLGVKNARASSTHRGPNVSVYDQDPPIQDDPEWNAWDKPVPYWWFHESRRFPLISPTGAPQVTEFSRYYGRPVGDNITGIIDSCDRRVIKMAGTSERLDAFHDVRHSLLLDHFNRADNGSWYDPAEMAPLWTPTNPNDYYYGDNGAYLESAWPWYYTDRPNLMAGLAQPEYAYSFPPGSDGSGGATISHLSSASPTTINGESAYWFQVPDGYSVYTASVFNDWTTFSRVLTPTEMAMIPAVTGGAVYVARFLVKDPQVLGGGRINATFSLVPRKADGDFTSIGNLGGVGDQRYLGGGVYEVILPIEVPDDAVALQLAYAIGTQSYDSSWPAGQRVLVGGFKIMAGVARTIPGPNAITEDYGPGHYVITQHASDNGGDSSIAFRIKDATSYWFACGYGIGYFDAGTLNVVQTWVADTSDGSELQVEVDDEEIVVRYNGGELWRGFDSALATYTRFGIVGAIIGGANPYHAYWLDFAVDEMVPTRFGDRATRLLSLGRLVAAAAPVTDTTTPATGLVIHNPYGGPLNRLVQPTQP